MDDFKLEGDKHAQNNQAVAQVKKSETPIQSTQLNDTAEPSAQIMKQGTQQPAAVLFAATQAEIVESNLDGKKEQRNDKQDL